MMNCEFCYKDLNTNLSFINLFSLNKENYCEHCKEKLSLKVYKHKSYKLYYLAHYEFIKDKIYSIKYFGDIKKAESFKAALNNFLQKNHFDLVLIAPSNRTREAIRGFNHVKIICDIAEIPYKDIFIEPYRLKQSKLYSERKYHNFSLNKDFTNNIISAKSILIIDDIFTSGNTLESLALVLLKINKELKISFLCLGKS